MARHYVLTRSAYAPEVPLEENRRRVELLRGVTARSLAAQTNKDFRWLVLVDECDPLLQDRVAALASAGVEVLVYPAGDKMDRTTTSDSPEGPWRDLIPWRDDVVLTTRLDDDDALAPWVMGRIRIVSDATDLGPPSVMMLPTGWRVIEGRVTPYTSFANQFATVRAAGRAITVMDVRHPLIGRLADVQIIAPRSAFGVGRHPYRPAWLWVRHGLARSSLSPSSQGGRDLAVPAGEAIRRRFPVDWDLLERLELPRGKWVASGASAEADYDARNDDGFGAGGRRRSR